MPSAAGRRPAAPRRRAPSKKRDYGMIVAAIVGCIAGGIILFFVARSMPTKARSGLIAGLPNSVPIERQPARTIESAGDVSALAFLPGAGGLLVGDREGLSLYEAATGKKQSRAFDTTKKGVRALAVAPGGKTVVAALSYTKLVRAVHATNDAVDPSMLRDAAAEVERLACSGDGRYVYGTGGKALYVWDARDLIEEEPGRVYSTTRDVSRKRLVRTVPLAAPATGMALAPGGGKVAVAVGREVVIFETPTFAVIRRLKAAGIEFGEVAFSPDGKRLVATCRLAPDHAAVVWNPETGAEVARVPSLREALVSSATHVAYSPDGQWFALAGDGGSVTLVGAATNKPVRILEQGADKVESLAFSPDSGTLAVGTNRGPVNLWTVSTN